jgi:hypothetical protein
LRRGAGALADRAPTAFQPTARTGRGGQGGGDELELEAGGVGGSVLLPVEVQDLLAGGAGVVGLAEARVQVAKVIQDVGFHADPAGRTEYGQCLAVVVHRRVR